MSQDHQWEDLQLSNSITHKLRAGRCPRPSARGLAAVIQDHSHTTDRQMPQEHQQKNLQLSNSITYLLKARRCKTISNKTCCCKTASLTSWRQDATRPSAGGLAAVKQDHLHPKGGEMPQDHQQKDLCGS